MRPAQEALSAPALHAARLGTSKLTFPPSGCAVWTQGWGPRDVPGSASASTHRQSRETNLCHRLAGEGGGDLRAGCHALDCSTFGL